MRPQRFQCSLLPFSPLSHLTCEEVEKEKSLAQTQSSITVFARNALHSTWTCNEPRKSHKFPDKYFTVKLETKTESATTQATISETSALGTCDFLEHSIGRFLCFSLTLTPCDCSSSVNRSFVHSVLCVQ